ncbi:hypothetical protein HIM_03180 [Hirsutella minnesotensis 3608]|nr:hypothetical protein HIM_03180 [Hirsutella minnesotensis 3608]
MAPLCADPRQVVIALPPPQRQALFKLVQEIISHMIRQIDTSPENLGPVAPEPDVGEKEEGSGERAKAPPPSAGPRDQRPSAARNESPEKRNSKAESILHDAIKHMLDWRDEFLPKLEKIVTVQDGAKIRAERQARREKLDKQRLDTPEDGENLISFGDVQVVRSEDVESLQTLYTPMSTELVKAPVEDRREALSCVLLLLLATGKYSAHSRALVLYLASALALSQTFVNKEEAEIAQSLMESSTADQGNKESMSAEAEAAKRRQENKFSRFWKVGLASVAGAAVIGVTGGLAAPLVAGAIGGIMGGVGLGGVASFLGIFWMNGALGEMMDSYAKEVEDFRFLPLEDERAKESSRSWQDAKSPSQRRLRVTIGINGWLNAEDDVTRPWRVLGPDTEVFALRYEMKTLLSLGTALQDMVQSFAWKAFKMEVIKRTRRPDPAHWRALRPVVSGNIFNVFSENDMVLGFVYRMHSLKLGVAGLQPVQGVAGVVNVDLSDMVSGHMRYPQLTGEILRRCGFVGVRAGSEIEQDDVIRMKHDHADGKLVDLDAPSADASQERRPADGRESLAKDLHGLNISPPALAQPYQAPPERADVKAPAPSSSVSQSCRPDGSQGGLNLAQSPVQPVLSRASPVITHPTRQGRPANREVKPRARQLTPDSASSDESDEELHPGIVLEDRDEDERHGGHA